MPVMVTVSDLAKQMRVDVHRFYEWARREEDPLPLRVAKGGRKSSVLVVSDWIAWWERNSELFKEARR